MPRTEPFDWNLNLSFLGSWTPRVTLADGTVFPERMPVVVALRDGPTVELLIEVENGQPVLTRVAFARTQQTALSPAMVREVKLAPLLEAVVGQTAAMALGVDQVMARRWSGGADFDRAAAQAQALAGRRPITDSLLREVAGIVTEYEGLDFRAEVGRRLHASPRTASRWISEARKRGFLEQEGV